MSAGYSEGGLDSFDEDAAANNLANVGQQYQGLIEQQQAGVPAVGAISGGSTIDTPPDVQQEAPGASAPKAPDIAPPASSETAALSIPPPPPPPALTGDPRQDVQNNTQYQRDLSDYHAKLTQHATALNVHAAGITKMKTEREMAAETSAINARKAEAAKYEQVRQQRQTAIDEAVKERVEARKSLEGGNDEQRLHGGKLAAAIAGGLGASLQMLGAAQMGHPQQFENQALKRIDQLSRERYEQKKQRLANASDSLLEARYGHKEAGDNHRAALNDLDANTAAEFKLAALEADNQLARMGYDKAQRDANEVVIKLREGQAKAEGSIHQREESTAAQKEQAKATLELARANLGERKNEHRDTLEEKQREFDLRKKDAAEKAADKEAAAKEKAAAKLDERAIRDPETDEVIRYAPTPRGVTAITDKQVAARAYSQGLRELADDIEKNGRVGSSLPIIGTEAGKRREELHANVVARGRKALDLGVSNANMQLEHGAVGGSGVGLARIGSPEVLRKIADDNDKFAGERLRSGTAPAKPKAAAAAPAAEPKAAKVPKDVIDQAWNAVNSPGAGKERRQKAVEILSAAGLL